MKKLLLISLVGLVCAEAKPVTPLPQEKRVLQSDGYYYIVPANSMGGRIDGKMAYLNNIISSGILQCEENDAWVTTPSGKSISDKAADRYMKTLTESESEKLITDPAYIPKRDSKEFKNLIKIETGLAKTGQSVCVSPVSKKEANAYKEAARQEKTDRENAAKQEQKKKDKANAARQKQEKTNRANAAKLKQEKKRQENAANLEQERLNRENTARLEQERIDRENAARLEEEKNRKENIAKQERIDRENAARQEQEKIDRANAARLKQESIDRENAARQTKIENDAKIAAAKAKADKFRQEKIDRANALMESARTRQQSNKEYQRKMNSQGQSDQMILIEK